jgi:integrase
MAMLNFLEGTLQKTGLTVHGFRSTFRDWAAEVTSHRREVIEQTLAHSLADASEAAYQRDDCSDKRRLLMNGWASHCFKRRFSQPGRQFT